MNRALSIVFAMIGLMSWFWPGFNGYFFPPSDIAAGDGRIIGAIFVVGAAILWFMPSSRKD